ncbi:hypothetical protein ANN_06233 [Periplaneta americana]|uniref:Uncharacterized protein n=1 Tax=Periplaneta americana TaxID=6978 RepID=A0ABQ8TE92_PERAM|nr:hypothetical protein ANN_06233 [Periplaneta americana]
MPCLGLPIDRGAQLCHTAGDHKRQFWVGVDVINANERAADVVPTYAPITISGRQHSLKWVKNKEGVAICTAVQEKAYLPAATGARWCYKRPAGMGESDDEGEEERRGNPAPGQLVEKLAKGWKNPCSFPSVGGFYSVRTSKSASGPLNLIYWVFLGNKRRLENDSDHIASFLCKTRVFRPDTGSASVRRERVSGGESSMRLFLSPDLLCSGIPADCLVVLFFRAPKEPELVGTRSSVPQEKETVEKEKNKSVVKETAKKEKETVEKEKNKSVVKETVKKEKETVEKEKNKSVVKDTVKKEKETVEKEKTIGGKGDGKKGEETVEKEKNKSVKETVKKKETVEKEKNKSVVKETVKKEETVEKEKNKSVVKETVKKEKETVEKEKNKSVKETVKKKVTVEKEKNKSVVKETVKKEKETVNREKGNRRRGVEMRKNGNKKRKMKENEKRRRRLRVREEERELGKEKNVEKDVEKIKEKVED